MKDSQATSSIGHSSSRVGCQNPCCSLSDASEISRLGRPPQSRPKEAIRRPPPCAFGKLGLVEPQDSMQPCIKSLPLLIHPIQTRQETNKTKSATQPRTCFAGDDELCRSISRTTLSRNLVPPTCTGRSLLVKPADFAPHPQRTAPHTLFHNADCP